MFGAIPLTSSCRPLKRRGPSRSAPTIRSVQRSPTRSSASARGDASRVSADWAMGSRLPHVPTHVLSTCNSQVTCRFRRDGAISMAVLEEITTSIEGLVERVGPAVVGLGRGGGRGSGVVTASGRVLTNAHNLRGDTVTVTFGDGRRETGTVAGVDLDADVAVVSVDTGDVEPVEWAAAGETAGIGRAVFALANPGGRGLRATFG